MVINTQTVAVTFFALYDMQVSVTGLGCTDFMVTALHNTGEDYNLR